MIRLGFGRCWKCCCMGWIWLVYVVGCRLLVILFCEFCDLGVCWVLVLCFCRCLCGLVVLVLVFLEWVCFL